MWSWPTGDFHARQEATAHCLVPKPGSHAPFQRAGRTWHAHLIFLLQALPCEAGFKGETAVAPGSGQAHSHKREQAHWPLACQTQSFQPGAHVAIHSARDEGTTLLDSPSLEPAVFPCVGRLSTCRWIGHSLVHPVWPPAHHGQGVLTKVDTSGGHYCQIFSLAESLPRGAAPSTCRPLVVKTTPTWMLSWRSHGPQPLRHSDP